MKRKTLKALFCAALMALTLSMTACGGSDAGKGADAATEEETAEKEEEPAKEEEAEKEEEPAEEESSGEMTLEEYLAATPGAEDELKNELAGAGDETMSAEAEVKGNDFILSFIIKDESLVTDDLGSQLDVGLEAAASVFETAAAQFDELIEQKGAVTLVIKYIDPDGNVVAERNFKGN